MQLIRSLYDWLGNKTYAKNATNSLAFFFFLDAIIFFPAEAILALFCLERRDRAYRYAAIATAASVIGGVVSYFMGCIIFVGDQRNGQSNHQNKYGNRSQRI